MIISKHSVIFKQCIIKTSKSEHQLSITSFFWKIPLCMDTKTQNYFQRAHYRKEEKMGHVDIWQKPTHYKAIILQDMYLLGNLFFLQDSYHLFCSQAWLTLFQYCLKINVVGEVPGPTLSVEELLFSNEALLIGI